jgi:thiol-disulfide isomerase/thioredoxin
MVMLKRFYLLIGCLLFALLPIVVHAADHSMRMMGTDGKQYALNDFIGKGQWVVVNVWATRCPYCREELFALGNFHDKHFLQRKRANLANTQQGKIKPAMVLGLTIQLPDFTMPDLDHVAQFKDDYLIDFPLLLVDQALAQRVIGKPIDMVPVSFFYNPAGELVYQLKGMATEALLEAIIDRTSSTFETSFAKEMPPEYRPK